MNLTVDELKEKIKKVEDDILNLRSNSGTIESIDTLTSYKEYLQAELKSLESKK